MNTFKLYLITGRRRFVNALSSALAIDWYERTYGERVLNWELTHEIPSGATVLNFQ